MMGAGHVTPAAALFWMVILWTWPFMTLGSVLMIWSSWRGRETMFDRLVRSDPIFFSFWIGVAVGAVITIGMMAR